MKKRISKYEKRKQRLININKRFVCSGLKIKEVDEKFKSMKGGKE